MRYFRRNTSEYNELKLNSFYKYLNSKTCVGEDFHYISKALMDVKIRPLTLWMVCSLIESE